MMVNYWAPNSNFDGIIRGRFPDTVKITEIKKGWTNFVFLAETENTRFVFRFPRTRFFIKAMLLEYDATRYIRRFIKKTAKQELHFFEKLPFTVHEYIEGEPLSAVFDSMTERQKQGIADEILEYLTKLQSIKVPPGWERLSNFLVRLAVATKNPGYDYNTFIELVKRENSDELVLCHGDFNADNILVADGHLVCVIDYAFITVSTPAADISRICNRMPAIAKYFSPNPKLVAMYDYIDNNYIEYMKVHHKEVEI